MFSLLSPSQNIGRIIIPNQRKWVASEEISRHEREAAQMTADFKGEKLTIFSSDGHALEAFHYAGQNPHTQGVVERTGQTVAIFTGQGAYHHWFSGYVNSYTKRGINVVTFNYPGIGQSEGESTCQAILHAGEGGVDYLENQLHLPRSSIAIHGHSLGGGFSAQAAKNRLGINIVNDRSYSKLSLASHHFIQSALPTNSFARSVFNALKLGRVLILF